MGREIKFRGKRADNGEWVYGAHFNMYHNDGREHIHHFIIPDNTDISLGTSIEKIQVEIIPETIGQFTGLTDCNGTPIYEGDILDTKTSDYVPNGYSFICKWIDSGFALIYQGRTYGVKERNNWMNKYPLCQKNVEDLIIMGNVFDNPELLK